MSEWKEIDDHPGYLVSNDGIIKNPKGRLLKSHLKNGYLMVTIRNNKKSYSVHRLVAKYFIPNPNGYPIVNHIDENKTNNNHTNLQWVTQKMNVHHSLNSGRTIQSTSSVKCFKNGIFVAEYSSVKEAQQIIGLTRHAIIRVCKGKNKTAGGFEWKYVNPRKDDIPKDGKEIDNYDNYLVTSDGRVYSKISKHFLKPMSNQNGYVYVTLCNKQKKRNHYIHRLVADNWIFKPTNIDNLVVNHKDSNKKNNDANNLEWITQSENVKHWQINKSH